jgi:hypothetical protein
MCRDVANQLSSSMLVAAGSKNDICRCESILELRARILIHANTASRNYTYKGQCNRCSPYSSTSCLFTHSRFAKESRLHVSNCDGFADPIDHATIENIVM